jgi:hypothetical protein
MGSLGDEGDVDGGGGMDLAAPLAFLCFFSSRLSFLYSSMNLLSFFACRCVCLILGYNIYRCCKVVEVKSALNEMRERKKMEKG